MSGGAPNATTRPIVIMSRVRTKRVLVARHPSHAPYLSPFSLDMHLQNLGSKPIDRFRDQDFSSEPYAEWSHEYHPLMQLRLTLYGAKR